MNDTETQLCLRIADLEAQLTVLDDTRKERDELQRRLDNCQAQYTLAIEKLDEIYKRLHKDTAHK